MNDLPIDVSVADPEPADERVVVSRVAIDWLKTHYPSLCIKAGLCESIGGRLYTRTFLPTTEAPAPSIPKELDVRTILLDVVPGDGDGVEVYARSVADVEAKLGKMGEELEDWQLGIRRYASSPQPEAAQPNLVDDEGVMNTPLLRAARLLVSGSHPSKDCAGPYMVPADLWLTLQAEVMESLRQAAARDLANPAQPEAAPAVVQVPQGWKLVPVEPTTAMINAGQCGCMDNDVTVCVYKDMLAAAPEAPAQAEVPVFAGWLREWEGDVSDLGQWLFAATEDEKDESPNWRPVYWLADAPEAPAQVVSSAGEVERDARILEEIALIESDPDTELSRGAKRALAWISAALSHKEQS